MQFLEMYGLIPEVKGNVLFVIIVLCSRNKCVLTVVEGGCTVFYGKKGWFSRGLGRPGTPLRGYAGGRLKDCFTLK